MNFLVTKPKQTQSGRATLTLWGLLWLAIILTVAGCNGGFGSTQEETSHSLVSSLEHKASMGGDHTGYDVSTHGVTIEQLLSESEYVAVHTAGADLAQFYTLARQNKMTQYPCSNCHIESLAALQLQAHAANAEVPQQAHWDINLKHADETVMTCLTCHTADNMDSLHTLTDEPIGFDDSYQLCAQCHAQQHKDWQGGAHGKQVGGWAPPRVVNNCVDCHSPHQPAWGTRWPAVTNTSSQE